MTPANPTQFLYLTTTGRKSGQPREIEIWFTERNGLYYVMAEYETSNWVRNLRANPDVQVRVSEKRFAARARILVAGTEDETCRAVQKLYQEKYDWSDGLIVELIPSQ